MGQKVNPHCFRVGPSLNKGWSSIFYAEKNYSNLLTQDMKIRKLVNTFHLAQIGRVLIERSSNKKNVIVGIFAKKPGVIIGKSGADIEKLKKDIQLIVNEEVYINIHEIKKPNIDALIVAQTITAQLEKRISFRKAMKSSIQACLKQGGLGIKISCSGRLGGAEIARTEWYLEGRVPLHTLRADIDYGTSEALTTYGKIGVKVWIYKGNTNDPVKNITKKNN